MKFCNSKTCRVLLLLGALLFSSFSANVRADALLQLFNVSYVELIQKMPELAEAGYTSLWLPPPTKGSGGLSVGYDMWDPFDFGQKDQRNTVRTRYGTEAELLQMMEVAHDMGVGNHFSRPGNSCYECPGLDRKCFSFMTCEQLTNWILCAGVYLHKTGDVEFLSQYHELLLQCLESLLNRDHPDADKRDGLMSFESSRTEGGGEITTYDSLDHSLGQARGNVYLAGKCWASYLALEKLFMQLNEPAAAASAHAAAVRCAESLEAAYDESLGFIPAVLENNNQSAIIPAAEALVYPWQMGLKDAVAENGPFGGYIRMLKRHLQNILNSDMCLYADGGWKLSSSADNSWMSKISISQFVVREILGMSYEGEERADAAHVSWQV
ncbi:MAG: hypothetical protein O2804_07380, partial [Verrucomicrobia bacterium]|nr:hypothetical protein [Verrucomicrobiota bacterium]